MASYKKKIVAFLVAVAFSSVATGICSAQSASVEASEQSFDNSGSLFAKDPNFSAGPINNASTRELFFKMMLAVLIVVALGVTTAYFSKKLLPRITNLSGKKMRVIETVHLGPRKMVHLLKIGNQQLLIGSTGESITNLADVTDTLSETDLSVTDTADN